VAGDGAGDAVEAVEGAVGVELLSSLSVGVSEVDAGGVPAVGVGVGDATDEVADDEAAELEAAPLLDVPLVDADAVGDGLEVLLGGGVVGGGVVGGGVDVEVALTASHCQIVGVEFTLPVTTPDPPPGAEAQVCGAKPTVTTNPAAVVSKTPPAVRPIDVGRTRAKHM